MRISQSPQRSYWPAHLALFLANKHGSLAQQFYALGCRRKDGWQSTQTFRAVGKQDVLVSSGSRAHVAEFGKPVNLCRFRRFERLFLFCGPEQAD